MVEKVVFLCFCVLDETKTFLRVEELHKTGPLTHGRSASFVLGSQFNVVFTNGSLLCDIRGCRCEVAILVDISNHDFERLTVFATGLSLFCFLLLVLSLREPFFLFLSLVICLRRFSHVVLVGLYDCVSRELFLI